MYLFCFYICVFISCHVIFSLAQCFVTNTGSVTTYDGASGFAGLELPKKAKKLVVSETTIDDSDICKFRTRVVTDGSVST